LIPPQDDRINIKLIIRKNLLICTHYGGLVYAITEAYPGLLWAYGCERPREETRKDPKRSNRRFDLKGKISDLSDWYLNPTGLIIRFDKRTDS